MLCSLKHLINVLIQHIYFLLGYSFGSARNFFTTASQDFDINFGNKGSNFNSNRNRDFIRMFALLSSTKEKLVGRSSTL